MQRAKTGEHVLGPKAQGGRLAGVELVAGLAHDHQIGDRSTGGFEQRHGFGLGIEGIELGSLAGGPAARRLLARQNHAQRRLLVARAVCPAEIAATDFEQARAIGTAVGIALGRA